MTEQQQSEPAHPSTAGSGMPRRAVLGAAAWSLPVVALAVATPAAAASQARTMTAVPAALTVATLPSALVPALTITLPDVTERTPVTVVLSGLKWGDTNGTASRTFVSYASGVFVVFGYSPRSEDPGYTLAWDDDGGAPTVIGVAVGSGTITFSADGFDDLAVPVTIEPGPQPGGGGGGTPLPEPPGTGGGGGGDIRP